MGRVSDVYIKREKNNIGIKIRHADIKKDIQLFKFTCPMLNVSSLRRAALVRGHSNN